MACWYNGRTIQMQIAASGREFREKKIFKIY
jgi:hypothetical protein